MSVCSKYYLSFGIKDNYPQNGVEFSTNQELKSFGAKKKINLNWGCEFGSECGAVEEFATYYGAKVLALTV